MTADKTGFGKFRTKSTTRVKGKRNRTGCLCCRKRRIKCDNGKPECEHCTRSRYECIWPHGEQALPHINEFKLVKRRNLRFVVRDRENKRPPPNANINRENSVVDHLLKDHTGTMQKEVDYDVLLRRYIQQAFGMSKLLIPTSEQDFTFVKAITKEDLSFYDAFMRGFLVAASPQLCCTSLQPSCLGITFNAISRPMFFACGAAYLCQKRIIPSDVARRRYQQALSFLVNFMDGETISGNEDWLLSVLLCLCELGKYFTDNITLNSMYLFAAFKIINQWREMNVNGYTLPYPYPTGLSQYIHPDDDLQERIIETNVDDVRGMFLRISEHFRPWQRTLLESFIYHYTFHLFVCRTPLESLPSPFIVFKTLKECLTSQIYKTPVAWMNNPILGASLPAFEVAAKVNWLALQLPLDGEKLHVASALLKYARYYAGPVLPPSVKSSEPKGVQNLLMQSCYAADMIVKSSLIFLKKLIHPDITSDDEEIQDAIFKFNRDLRQISLQSQTAIICPWGIAVAGAAMTSKEDQEYLLWRLGEFCEVTPSQMMPSVKRYLQTVWSGPGIDCLLYHSYATHIFM